MRFIRLVLAATILISFSAGAQTKVGESIRPHNVLTKPCETCHNPDTWHNIHFDHKTTAFPLTGLHSKVDCKQCHNLVDFSIVEKTCSGCHEDIHRRQLGNQCETCHTPDQWQNVRAGVAHSKTRFPLLGQHQNLDCTTCHASGMNTTNFIHISEQCESCHLKDYANAATLGINHPAAGFSTHCESCHDTQIWKKGRFNHPSSFAIYFGEHMMQWEICTTCHPDRNNFKVNYCGKCHDFNTFSDAHGD